MDETITVQTAPCILCGEPSVFTLDRAKFMRWQAGEHIQHVFPELSADDRETLINGTHGPCFDKIADPKGK